MRAMVLDEPGQPLRLEERPIPEPGEGEVRVRVRACGVCRTDLHVVEGELTEPSLPIVPGHEVVGDVDAIGPGVTRFTAGDRVGVPWLGRTCGRCRLCRSGRENLCETARFTGYQLDGGYADYALAHQDFTFPVATTYAPQAAAPLLCAGLIGYRSWRLTGRAERVGFYGFGAAAHLLVQLARWEGAEVYAFTRPGDEPAQRFARDMGAVWAGGSDQAPPVPLDAALIFAPVGPLVPAALRAVDKGGAVVCAGIHMSDIPSFPYRILWEERTIRSVANLTRRDGEEFLELAPRVPVRTETHAYPLEEANRALDDLRAGRFTGAAVLVPETQPAH